MSYIGFMRNTVNHIEKLFNKYLQNMRKHDLTAVVELRKAMK